MLLLCKWRIRGSYVWKCWGEFISFFLNIPWKWNNLVSLIFIGYLKMGRVGGFKRIPSGSATEFCSYFVMYEFLLPFPCCLTIISPRKGELVGLLIMFLRLCVFVRLCSDVSSSWCNRLWHVLIRFTYLNPFKSIGNSYTYQLDQSISVLMVVVWYFIHFFSSNFHGTFGKQTVETLIRRRILHCLYMSHKIMRCYAYMGLFRFSEQAVVSPAKSLFWIWFYLVGQ